MLFFLCPIQQSKPRIYNMSATLKLVDRDGMGMGVWVGMDQVLWYCGESVSSSCADGL